MITLDLDLTFYLLIPYRYSRRSVSSTIGIMRSIAICGAHSKATSARLNILYFRALYKELSVVIYNLCIENPMGELFQEYDVYRSLDAIKLNYFRK